MIRTALTVHIAVVLCCTLSQQAFSQTKIEPSQPWTVCCRGWGFGHEAEQQRDAAAKAEEQRKAQEAARQAEERRKAQGAQGF
jgi:hypothetical protein